MLSSGLPIPAISPKTLCTYTTAIILNTLIDYITLILPSPLKDVTCNIFKFCAFVRVIGVTEVTRSASDLESWHALTRQSISILYKLTACHEESGYKLTHTSFARASWKAYNGSEMWLFRPFILSLTLLVFYVSAQDFDSTEVLKEKHNYQVSISLFSLMLSKTEIYDITRAMLRVCARLS